MENAEFWVIENDLGEPIDIIYQNEPELRPEWLDLLEEHRWTATRFLPPEPAWEMFQRLEGL